LVLVALVPLLVGPALAGTWLLWHDHDMEGRHGHVLSGLAVSDHHDAHHDDHHGNPGDGRHGEHERSHLPHGLLFELPALAILSTNTARWADTVAQMLTWNRGRPSIHGVAPSETALLGLRDRRPLRRGHGSGAARILRANHALLI
jgi:hypothetical protein